jgi:hypothetical protein
MQGSFQAGFDIIFPSDYEEYYQRINIYYSFFKDLGIGFDEQWYTIPENS